jgi:alkylated DNA repair dioxygenase AlkB
MINRDNVRFIASRIYAGKFFHPSTTKSTPIFIPVRYTNAIHSHAALIEYSMTQAGFFEGHESGTKLPEGLRYRSQLITPAEEEILIARVSDLPFKEFEFHGFKGRRRTVSFGWQYEFSGRGRLRKANEIPQFFLPLRAVAAEFAQIEPDSLQHVLVVEYGPGAGIGWHRDKPVFGEVIGVSLLAPCVLRFRRKLSNEKDGERIREVKTRGVDRFEGSKMQSVSAKAKWDRVNILAEPRSAYHLTGPARSEWQHSILRVDELRYSITFRNLRED